MDGLYALRYRRVVLAILLIVLPIFALILAGWLSGRTGVLGAPAAREINRFVVWLALPALLFDIIAHVRWSEIWRPGFVAATAAGMALIFALTVLIRGCEPHHVADGAVDGLNAAYPNNGFMGFPIGLAVLGRESLPLITVSVLLTICLLFAIAIVIIEASLHRGKGGRAILAQVGGALVRNPLLVAPVLGAVTALSGVVIPQPVEAFLKLLGGATSPCALVSIGLFLAHQRGVGGRIDGRAVALLVGLKLVVQPAVTGVVAGPLLGLPHPVVVAAVLLAALPTGTGPYMVAEYYGREGATTSRVILISTILSIVTIPLWLSLWL
ncbi:MAG TPA: AEC family transporter [Sphingobium sp.]